MMTRRNFLLASGAALAAVQPRLLAAAESSPVVQTVLGPLPATKLGFTLAHEHVMCDFIGAGETGRHRWDVEAVVKRMRPVLAQLKERGVTGFIDCTPAFIGRDPRVLKRLAEETGLHIVTNTGYYGGANDKYVPSHAYTETPDQLAARWMKEVREGIEGTGVKPGFLKIGVDEIAGERLSDIDEKLVRAAARVALETGLATVCHTGGGAAGLAATKLFISEKARADRFIVAHSDGHGLPINEQVAGLGAWVSLDGISRQPLEQHLKLVTALVPKHAGRLLLSQDNGWYWVGQENGGEVRDFNYLADTFLPALKREFDPAVIRKLTVENPTQAFAIRRG